MWRTVRVIGAVGNYATMGTQLAKQGKTKIALLRPDSNTSGALAPFISPAIEAGGGEFRLETAPPSREFGRWEVQVAGRAVGHTQARRFGFGLGSWPLPA